MSGWAYGHQLIVIDFLQAENRLIEERLRGKLAQNAKVAKFAGIKTE